MTSTPSPTAEIRTLARAVLARALLLLLGLALPSLASAAVRVKDLASVQGVRDNELFGYGLVVGLAGTGDSALLRGLSCTPRP